MTNEKSESFYHRLREQLANDRVWPAPYLFKFIVPAGKRRSEMVCEFFESFQADIRVRESSNGNYSSISIELVMDSPEAIIQKYKEVSVVEGVISL